MKKIFKSLIYLTCLAASLSQDVKAQNMQQWVPDPTVGILYLTGINGNFTRMVNSSGESIQVLLVLQRTGNATLSLGREIPEIPKDIRGTWELRNGKVYIALENKWMIQAEAVSRVSRSKTSPNPRMITSLYLQSKMLPPSLQGDYKTFASMNFDSDKITEVMADRYINPPTEILATTVVSIPSSIPLKVTGINELERQGENLNSEIERLKAEVARAKEAQIVKEKAEKIRITEESAKKKVEEKEREISVQKRIAEDKKRREFLNSPEGKRQMAAAEEKERSRIRFQIVFICTDPYGGGVDRNLAVNLLKELYYGSSGIYSAMITNSTYMKYCMQQIMPVANSKIVDQQGDLLFNDHTTKYYLLPIGSNATAGVIEK